MLVTSCRALLFVPALLALPALAACNGGSGSGPADAGEDFALPDGPDAPADADADPAADGGDGSLPDAEPDGGDAADVTDAEEADAPGPTIVEAANPVITGDRPDPHVIRTIGADGRPVYTLVHTTGNGGDIPVLTSTDLIHWTEQPRRIFDRPSTAGSSIEINGAHFCDLWAPQIVQVGPAVFLLSFSATRRSSPQSPCPGYGEDGGVYLASSVSELGPFAVADRAWEPLPAGGHIVDCPASTENEIPHSVDWASPDCQGNYCHKIIRLDSDVFHDEVTGRWWMTYSWFTNSPPLVEWETVNFGEHTNIVELDAADPWTVICDPAVLQIHLANPHDGATLAALASYCPRCGEMLSMTRGRYNEEMERYGCSWGVVEGANLFRRGDWIYAFISGSAYDSAYYHVYWVAARTVEGLACTSGERLVGRYLVPSLDQSFGHGTAVLGPDGESWYFVHHRLDHGPCMTSGYCARDVWVSPIRFEDRGDGLGEVWVAARFPAEDPSVRVVIPP
jgi:beta-xylosidase